MFFCKTCTGGIHVPQITSKADALEVIKRTKFAPAGNKIDNPIVEEKMLEIISKCSKKNVTVGTFTDTLENAMKKPISQSLDFGLTFGGSVHFLGEHFLFCSQ